MYRFLWSIGTVSTVSHGLLEGCMGAGAFPKFPVFAKFPKILGILVFRVFPKSLM